MSHRTAVVVLAVWSAIFAATNIMPAVTPYAMVSLCVSGMVIAAIWIKDDLSQNR